MGKSIGFIKHLGLSFTLLALSQSIATAKESVQFVLSGTEPYGISTQSNTNNTDLSINTDVAVQANTNATNSIDNISLDAIEDTSVNQSAQNPDDKSLNLDAIRENNSPIKSSKGSVNFYMAVSLLEKPNPRFDVILDYFKLASDEGFCQAHGYAGMFYLNGYGTEPNGDLAHKYFALGEKCEDAQSIYGIGYSYSYGIGIAQDKNKAKTYLKRASDLNYAPAQYELSLILFTENPASKDALEYLRLATKNRYQPALDLYYQALNLDASSVVESSNEIDLYNK